MNVKKLDNIAQKKTNNMLFVLAISLSGLLKGATLQNLDVEVWN